MEAIVLILSSILIFASGELYDGECAAPPVTIDCGEAKIQANFHGLSSDAPLFTDANIKAKCKDYGKNIFKDESSKKAYVPFTDHIVCEENEAITGLELCYQADLVYIAAYCSPLEDGYTTDSFLTAGESNNPEYHGVLENVSCQEGEIMKSISLSQDEESGNIYAYVSCVALTG